MIGPRHEGSSRDRDGEPGRIVADLAHHLDRDHAGAGGVADGAAGHAGDHHVHDHGDVAEAGAGPADHRVGRGPDAPEMVAAFITLPARMNIGIASSTLSWNAELSVWSTIRPMSCLLGPEVHEAAAEHHQRDREAQHREHDEGRAHQEDRIAQHCQMSSAQHVGALVGAHHRDLVAPVRAGKSRTSLSAARTITETQNTTKQE